MSVPESFPSQSSPGAGELFDGGDRSPNQQKFPVQPLPLCPALFPAHGKPQAPWRIKSKVASCTGELFILEGGFHVAP